MATQWVKSLQCKSTAANDVVEGHHRHKTQKHRPIADVSSSCRKGVQSLKDVIEFETTEPEKYKKKKPPKQPKPGSNRERARVQAVTVGRFFPALAELPAGHPSRNVVEIIFRSSWSPEPFSGRVEVVFKIRNSSRTTTRFEEYREEVKSRVRYGGGGEDDARCAADGNEVMGFHCPGPTDGGRGGAWDYDVGKGAVRVFSGGGGAHVSGGRGRRAMLVCRVIAGRVCKQVGLSEGRLGFDSVSGENGELVVSDSRAVLPCFLILYKL